MSSLSGKIINDPVYGFINLPGGLIMDLIEHPYFQRLRRIKQLGLTDYVYPGAVHTRFHHALGALHLMQESIKVLKSKNVKISKKEEEALCIAILLHDIGHGPFSHVLEHTLTNVHHETMSKLLMQKLNEQFKGRLALAIQIFEGSYSKKFFHQLVSGQLDMDRMDYLNRDSFFTGVSEGIIGYDRIIKMIDVRNDELVVEQKGIYSIEKFLVARRLMYWQCYLHKTVWAIEQMLIKVFERARELAKKDFQFEIPSSLHYIIQKAVNSRKNQKIDAEFVENFAALDDSDVLAALKSFRKSKDEALQRISTAILDRKIFKVEVQNKRFTRDYVRKVRHNVGKLINVAPELRKFFVFEGKESNTIYSSYQDQIKILYKNGDVVPVSDLKDLDLNQKIFTKYYLCYVENK